MRPNQLKIIRDLPLRTISTEQELVITFDELKQWVVSGAILKHLFRYQEVRLLTYRADVIIKPFLIAVVIKLLSRGTCFIEDRNGIRQSVTIAYIAKLFVQVINDFFRKRNLVAAIENELSGIEGHASRPAVARPDSVSGSPAYLRTDLWYGVSSGGSVGHIAGVLNNLNQITERPVFLASDVIPTVRQDIETSIIDPAPLFWDFLELPDLFYNVNFYQESRKILDDRKLAFIYQRYSLNNYTGLKLARHYGIPLVLEYNGSEIWVGRHWRKPLKYESLSERIEMLNLRAAHLVIVVSQALKNELRGRGLEPEKILVNPNGVDPGKYSPDVKGSAVRGKYCLSDKTVIGFIGTFGRWHGAEVLAEAFGLLLKEHPAYRDSVRLLMIGDGMTMPLVKDTLAKYAVNEACILTGRIPQEEGPAHLAACDILASPHVPNPDGTPFFGSPTKLFEYMAMGKGIVASDLDQIGEILKHDRTAWMVRPGDPESLKQGLKKLIDDKELRDRLGMAAREEVVAKYTWKEHTRKIIKRLQEVTAGNHRKQLQQG